MAASGGADGARPALGTARRWALAGYRRLPRRLRLAVVRLVAPSHTLGAVVALEHDGRILVLRQHHRPGWTLPGGLVDRGETAAEAACREVAEETGLRVEVGLPVAVVVEPRSRRVDVVFRVGVDAPPDVRPASEARRAAWLPPDRLGDVDEPTEKILAVLAATRRPGAYEGRVVGAAGTRAP